MPDIGSAPNKTFQRTDGTRTGPETWQEAQAAVVGIESDDHDTHDQDVAVAISNRLMLDGGNQPTAAMPWNAQLITNYGAPTARTNAQRVDKVQDSSHVFAGTSSGTDTITATLSPAITAYVAGQRYHFKAGGTNTGAATINFNSVGAAALRKGADGATVLAPGDITTAGIYTVIYDGTNFQLLNPKTPVGYIVGTDIQAYDELLAEIAALSTDPNADSGLFFDDSADAMGFWTPSAPLAFSGTALTVAAASDSAAGIQENAVQSEMETASSTTLNVVPGRQHFHPGHPKAWVSFNQQGTQAIINDHGVTSIADVGVGKTDITLDTAFSSTSYAWLGTVSRSSGGNDPAYMVSAWNADSKTTTVIKSQAIKGDQAVHDHPEVTVVTFGDQ